MLAQSYTLPTKTLGNTRQQILVNKYGIHKNQIADMLDTGMGFCYRSMDTKTHSFPEYEQNNIDDPEYPQVMTYIKEHSVPYDASKKAKLNIKIINHAYPLIQLAPNSRIYQDNNPIFKNKDAIWKHTIMDHPPVNDYKPDQLYEHIADKKPTQTQISECTVDLVANQWSMLYWNSYFNGNFMHFYSEDDQDNQYYTQDKDFQLLPHAPGGKTNLGNYDKGQKNEYFIEEGATYELQFVVSPAIKIKTDCDYSNSHLRYPYTIYPFINGKNILDKEPFAQQYSCDLHASITEGDSWKIINGNKWQFEHNFGIDITFSHK